MKNFELKKMSLANIENRLTPEEMENVMAGSFWNCNSVTGAFCMSTVYLAFSGPFASLAAATGIGCALGIYAGCTH
jgi:hypothetical protein